MAQAEESPTERVYITPSTKMALNAMKQPKERYGDVIARLISEKKQDEYIAHLDRIAARGNFVPMDSDPEYAEMKNGAAHAG